MTDLVRRLRTNPMKNRILREAADEIERLQEHIATMTKLTDQIAALRADLVNAGILRQ